MFGLPKQLGKVTLTKVYVWQEGPLRGGVTSDVRGFACSLRSFGRRMTIDKIPPAVHQRWECSKAIFTQGTPGHTGMLGWPPNFEACRLP
jgi:hypothetical protein